jgi:hypothetical protein
MGRYRFIALALASIVALPVAGRAQQQDTTHRPLTAQQVGKNVANETKRVSKRVGKTVKKAGKDTQAETKRVAKRTGKTVNKAASDTKKEEKRAEPRIHRALTPPKRHRVRTPLADTVVRPQL